LRLDFLFLLHDCAKYFVSRLLPERHGGLVGQKDRHMVNA